MADVRVEKTRYTVDSLYQWDKNQVLKIYGLSVASIPEIHFTNSAMDRAIVRQATVDVAGVISVDIPNSLLQKPYKITVYICTYEGGTFKTDYSMIIPVEARNKPKDYTLELTDNEVYSFNALENRVENVLKESLELYEKSTDEYNKSRNALNMAISSSEAAAEKLNEATGKFDEATEKFNDAVTTFEADGGIVTRQLADDAVTTEKIADDAVTDEKLARNYWERYSYFGIEFWSQLDSLFNESNRYNVGKTIFRMNFDPLFPGADMLGEDEYLVIANYDQNQLLLTNFATGATFLYTKGSNEIYPNVISDTSLECMYWELSRLLSVSSYADLDNLLTNATGQKTMYQLRFDTTFPRSALLGNDYYIGIINPAGDGMILFNTVNGNVFTYIKGSGTIGSPTLDLIARVTALEAKTADL